MHTDHKKRWILSPRQANGKPLAAEYALQWDAFLLNDGKELVSCIMNAQQLAAAKADSNLVVMDSLHSQNPVHPEIAANYSTFGVLTTHTPHQALYVLSSHHPNMEPDV